MEIFECAKLYNGWVLKCKWIEQGTPQAEQLYCKDIETAGALMAVWSRNSFDEAVRWLADRNKFKEA